MNDLEKGTASDDPEVPYSSDELEASCAKIWAVYISEAEKYDKALVESWRGNMDGMLIFAGLFSASLTAFIVESYKTLTPDSSDTMAALLKQISGQLAASASGTIFEVPPATAFVVPVSSVICNVLWFTSLGFSLACALVATLVEQWARDFIQRADMRPSPVIRARIFSYLYYGLKRFNMHLVVEVVPLLLHMSLVLFFAGLVAFLLPIHPGVMGVSAAVLGILVIMYCYLTVMPLVSFDSPYRTPLSWVLWRTSQLWQSTTSSLWVSVGRQNQSEGSMEGTMVQGVIHQAVQPSTERNGRDLRALTWTVKSLVDNTELELFIDGIPDMLWGPSGRRFKHDHLIWSLIDDPDVHLGGRLLELVEYSDSGLLSPSHQLRHKVSCLKALWAMGILSKRGTPLNLPVQVLQVKNWMTRSGTKSVSEGISPYLPATQASLNWSLLCAFDSLWGLLKSEIQTCLGTSPAGPTPSLEPIRKVLHQMLQDDPKLVERRAVDEVPLFDRATAESLAVVNPFTTDTTPSSWLTSVQSFANTQETFWDNACHTILHDFLRASLSSSEDPSTIFEFQSTLDMCLSGLPPPSAFSSATYSRLLDFIAHWDGLAEPLRGYNAQVVTVILSLIFPIGGTQAPHEYTTNFVIPAYLKLALNSPSSDSAFFALRRCNIYHVWYAMGQYLISGWQAWSSINTQATLEVMCRLNHWFWNRHRGSSERDSLKVHWPTEPSPFASVPSCPPLTSMLALGKIETLDSLLHQEVQLQQRIEFRSPTQADWDECNSLLSHSLYSTEDLEVDAEFDFERCEDAEERAGRYRRLLSLVHTRLQDAFAVLCIEYLEACSEATPPYYAPETLTRMAHARIITLSFGQLRTEMRFANSIAALIKARDMTPEHARIWKHLVLESPLLNFKLDDQSAMAVIKNALEEAKSDDPLERARVEGILENLDALLEARVVLEEEQLLSGE
ncbi:hypothetical protein C8R46DRAFT_33439 [Mycena filopes]|nr:hypothetical protein C8R46DRAFT_33439 [Mycena filopes]